MEYVIVIGLGAALGVLTVRTDDGWAATIAVLVVLAWSIVMVLQTYPPPVGMAFGLTTVAVGVALRVLERRRLRRAILAAEGQSSRN